MNKPYTWDGSWMLKWEDHARRKFKDFQAIEILQAPNDCLWAIDWRNKNGGNNYYIRFVQDYKKGNLYVTGDLGEGILHVDGKPTTYDWAYYTPDYFLEKVKVSSESPYFDHDLFISDFLKKIGETKESAEDKDIMNDIRYLSGYCGDTYGKVFSEDMENSLEQLTGGSEYGEWLPACGRRYPQRIILWKEALEMIEEIKIA